MPSFGAESDKDEGIVGLLMWGNLIGWGGGVGPQSCVLQPMLRNISISGHLHDNEFSFLFHTTTRPVHVWA